MCGFAGWSGERNDALLVRANGRQRHRGPDGDDVYISADGRVSMIASRLVILDAAGGSQPMSDTARGVTVVYAGELANARPLRVELERRGHVFRSDHSDTEVVLRAYIEYGEEVVGHLNGMFAFVLHDAGRHRLFGAVDRFAIKPLYYASNDHSFAFATELKAIAALPWVDTRIDRQAFYDALSFHCVPAPQSIFAGARKLGPAQSFSFDARTHGLTVQTYWSPTIADEPSTEAERPLDPGLPAQCLRAIDTALERWSDADVPVGFALSGGIDSSVLVALAARRGTPVRTFFSMLEGETEGPRDWARAMAAQYRTVHTEIIVRPEEIAENLDSIVYHLDEPYGGSIPSWFLFRRMSRDVRVAITGLGGDELFGNYGKWRSEILPNDDAPAAQARARAAAIAMRQHGRFHHHCLADAFKRERLFTPEFAEGCRDSEAQVAALRARSGSRDPRSIVPFVDWHVQLPHELLHVTDRLSMAHGLEARPPFLDGDLVDTIWRVRPSQRTNARHPKALLIAAAQHLLPPGLAAAPKAGFAFPLDRLLTGALAERVSDLLSPHRIRQQGIFRSDLLSTLVAPHAEGRRQLTQPLWSVLMAQVWCTTFANAGLAGR